MKRILSTNESILWYLAIIVVCIIFLFPFFYTLLNAFKPIRLIQVYPPTLLFKPILRNFVTAITKYHLHINMLNSLVISLGATAIGVFLGAMSAYAISRYNQRKIALLIVLFMMLPYMVCLLPIYVIFARMQLIDTFRGLILAHLIITVPQSVWILTGFIEGIPKDLEEAAVLDGCTKAGSFFRIVLPLIRPGLAATSVLSFTLSWNNFNLALVLSRSKTMTAPLGVYHFVAYESIDWGGLSAAVILLVIPALFFALTAQKHLVRGLAVGGLTGG